MTDRRELATLLVLTIALLAAGCSAVRPPLASLPAVTEASKQAESQSVTAVERPATSDDLRILERADEILSDSTKWDRADDRICNPSDTTWSLFCAVKRATEEVLGAYRHDDKMGQAALREVRRVIEDLNPGRTFQHRPMDYNNLPSTTCQDIKKVLHLARQRVATALAARAVEK